MMKDKFEDKPAFPKISQTNEEEYTVSDIGSKGMTLKEWYVGMADIPWNAVMETLKIAGIEEPTIKQIVECRAKFKLWEADAIIKELNDGAR